jgi:hypothetical protein
VAFGDAGGVADRANLGEEGGVDLGDGRTLDLEREGEACGDKGGDGCGEGDLAGDNKGSGGSGSESSSSGSVLIYKGGVKL